jgi:hypothetical protein
MEEQAALPLQTQPAVDRVGTMAWDQNIVAVLGCTLTSRKYLTKTTSFFIRKRRKTKAAASFFFPTATLCID